jgi:hypothetical protein
MRMEGVYLIFVCVNYRQNTMLKAHHAAYNQKLQNSSKNKAGDTDVINFIVACLCVRGKWRAYFTH